MSGTITPLSPFDDDFDHDGFKILYQKWLDSVSKTKRKRHLKDIREAKKIADRLATDFDQIIKK